MALTFYEVQLEIEPLVLTGEEVKPFVERLVDDIHAAGHAVKGVNLFYNEMPEEDPTPCLLVRDMGGVPDMGAPMATADVLFQARGGTWSEAREFSAAVFNHYHQSTGRYITGYRIIAAKMQSLPTSMGEDENQRHLVGWNASFLFHSTNQQSEQVGYGGTRDPNEP